MKSLILTAVLLTFGLMFVFYRRRLKLAIMVAGSLYLVLTVARFVVLREEADRFEQLGLAVGVLAAVWLVTNLITALVQRHRQRGARR